MPKAIGGQPQLVVMLIKCINFINQFSINLGFCKKLKRKKYLLFNFKKNVSEILVINVFFFFHFIQHVAACEAMNGCLSCLAGEYPTVKFCKISALDAKMSFKFVRTCCSIILVIMVVIIKGKFLKNYNL